MGAPLKQAVTKFRPKDRPTQKQHDFVQEYLSNGRNAPLAYATVYARNWKKGDPMTGNYKTTGVRYLKHPKINKLLAEAEEKVHAVTVRVMSKYAITQERVLEELANLAFTSQTDLVSWDKENGVTIKDSSELSDATKSAITEIIETKKGVRVKLADKQQALLTLAKHLGLMNDKVEHEHRHVQFVITKD